MRSGLSARVPTGLDEARLWSIPGNRVLWKALFFLKSLQSHFKCLWVVPADHPHFRKLRLARHSTDGSVTHPKAKGTLTCEGFVGCGETKPWEVIVMGETLFGGFPRVRDDTYPTNVCWKSFSGSRWRKWLLYAVWWDPGDWSATDMMMVMCVCVRVCGGAGRGVEYACMEAL